MATMKRVYRDAQAACGLKVGDWVKVARASDDFECGWGMRWDSYKAMMVGKIGNIIKIGEDTIHVSFGEDGENYFPYFVLEKVEKPKHEFKPFDKVLVRDNLKENWRCNIYSHKDNANLYHCTGKSNWWQYCIPYEGNEHLLGTTDMPEE